MTVQPLQPVLQTLTCPNCSNPIQQKSAASQTLVCPTCKTAVVMSMDGAENYGKAGMMSPPPVPIAVGDTAKINDTNFFVLGRVVYEGWDDEDRWRWTEWQIGGSDGRLLWLSYSKDEGFYLFRKIKLTQPFDPLKDRKLPVGKQGAVVRERYPARIIAAEGELTFRAKEGDRLQMIEGVSLGGGGLHYSIQVTTSELEVHEGQAWSEADLAKAFNNSTWTAQISKMKKGSDLRGMVGIAAILFALIAFVGGFVAGGNRRVAAQQDFTLIAQAPTAVMKVNLPASSRPGSVKVNLITKMSNGQSADIDVSIDYPGDLEVQMIEADFYSESGYDDGEYWSESVVEAEAMFIPDEAGEYQFEVALGANVGVPQPVVRLAIYRDTINPIWMWGYAVIALIIGIILLISAAKRSTAKKM
jgi:hypothetical protein